MTEKPPTNVESSSEDPTNERNRQMLKALTSMALVVGSMVLSGCNGALVGNVIVLGVTFGIFFGTLRLGRNTEATRSEAPTSSTAGRS